MGLKSRRLLGMANYYTKFFPQLASITEPIRELLRKDREWHWDANQENSFQKIKKILTTAPVLTFFETNRNTRISADASLAGLGAVLEQEVSKGVWKPVQYASRSLNETEKRYSNIEREALGIVWACERFQDYILGGNVIVQTDHKPLLSLLGHKPLNELTPRIQRLRMRLMRFQTSLEYIPGKNFFTPDTLSRCPIKNNIPQQNKTDDLEYLANLVGQPNVSDRILENVKKAQENDEEIKMLKDYVANGWSDRMSNVSFKYKRYSNDLWINRDILMYGQRVVIPLVLQKEIIEKIHEGHGGQKRSLKRAKDTVWWPNINQHIIEKVNKCRTCLEHRYQPPEPMIPSKLPERPWQILGIDYFKANGNWFLAVGDYYSRFLDIQNMSNDLKTTAAIKYLKRLFAFFGIPEVIRCDQATNLNSFEMQEFAKSWGFHIVTSSAKYPASNGFAEAMVKISKNIVMKGDIDLGLLAYRSTPTELGHSPSEMLMGRKVRGTLPINPERLRPKWPDLVNLRRDDEHLRQRGEHNFNARHRVKPLPELREGDEVWVQDRKEYGRIIKKFEGAPRRYLIRMPNQGVIDRNRRMIIKTYKP